MQLFRLRRSDQNEFDAISEVAMDLHFAQAGDKNFYLVVGGRVGIILNENTFSEPGEDLVGQSWLQRGMASQERAAAFQNWLGSLNEAPILIGATPVQAWLSFWSAFSPVTPIIPLPPAPLRPSWIYGHLPFSTTTRPDTMIYRWEAFPTSRRISTNPPTIAADTYAAPASEVPFAPTGFAAVARFALPNLMPACFRWELQPAPGTKLECGASVPLYGQSGGGVEVKFTNLTSNRCPIANPVLLPEL